MGRPAQAFEGGPPEPAGGPHEPAGDGRPRWMIAQRDRREAPGDRTRRTGRLVRPCLSTESILSDTIDPVEYSGFSWTAGARKHRVSRSRVRNVVTQAELYFVRPAAPPGQPDEALLFLGADQEGERLEVVGVELADGRLRIVHAMAMRIGYEDMYEEAKTWRE